MSFKTLSTTADGRVFASSEAEWAGAGGGLWVSPEEQKYKRMGMMGKAVGLKGLSRLRVFGSGCIRRLSGSLAIALALLTLGVPVMQAQAQGTEAPPGIRVGIAQSNGVKVTMPNGFVSIAQTDMSLASVAGDVPWVRSWDGREWKFNPRWESLSVSWSNLTGGRLADGSGAAIGISGCDRTVDPDCKEPPPDDQTCYVWVDEDWQPSGEVVRIGSASGGSATDAYEFVAEPIPPVRGTPFNKVIGGAASSSDYAPGTYVNADWLSLCGGGGGGGGAVYSQGQELEGIRRINELYLGEGGRYAFSNRAVLEKRAVRELPTTAAAQLASGSVTLNPATNPKGYRWIDRSGEWIDYNTQGQVVAYGDRNANTVWLVRDDAGTVRGVVDPNGRVLYSLHYTGELLTEVRDYPVAGLTGDLPQRTIRYQYDAGNRLSAVIDVRGNTTRYGYNRSGQISQITDPEGRIETLAYKNNLVSQHTAADGGVTDYEFSFDDVNKQFTSKIKGPETAAGRRSETLTHNRVGKLVRQAVNGRVDLEMIYDSGARIEQSTNARGFTSQLQRNEFEQVTRETHEDGSTIRRSYSALHLELTELVDPLGIKIQYLHDSKGNLLKKIQAAGTPDERVTEYALNELGQVTQVMRKGRLEVTGVVTPDALSQIEYNSQGQVAKTVDPEGGVRRYSYNRAGQLIRVIDPRGNAVTYEVDAQGRLLKYTDALGYVRSFTHDKVGNLLSKVDARGKAELMAYDAMNRRVANTNQVGGVWQTQYNLHGLPVVEIDEDGRRSEFAFDNFLRSTKQVDPLGNSIEFDYQISDGSTGGQLGSLGLPTQINYPTYTQHSRFDARGRLISQSQKYRNAQGEQTVNVGVTYDRRGKVLTETDANDNIRRHSYNAFGQPIEVVDALGGKTKNRFDARGNLIELQDALGNAHRFEYDRNNSLVKETRPLGQVTHYQYDAVGNLAQKIDPNGNRHILTLDAANRVTQIIERDTADTLLRTIKWNWDANSNLIAWSDVDHSRNLTSSAVLSYDDANRKTNETVAYPSGLRLSYGSTYSPAGKRTSLTWPDGTRIDYGYSQHGELQRVSIPGEGTISVNEYSWTAPKKTTLPGGSTQNKSFDGLLNLETINVKNPGQQNTLSLNNRYGKVQELHERNRTDTANNSSRSLSEQFSYDAELRLTQVQRELGGLFGTSSQTFTLDAVANRIADSRVSGESQYDTNNRLQKIGSGDCGANDTTCYQWDDNGNLIQKTEAGNRITQYHYDSRSRLIEVGQGNGQIIARYGYDPLNRRLWKEQYRDRTGQTLSQAKRTLYLYSDEGLIGEASQGITLNGDGSVTAQHEPILTAQYGPRPDSNFTTGTLFVKTQNSNGQDAFAYYHHDHLGTPIQASDKLGNVVWAASYEAFGMANLITPAATVDKPTIANNLRFPGQYEDAETGLHYNWNRYYDPQTGRYVTADPIGVRGGVNLFLYSESSPTKFIDEKGLSSGCHPVLKALGWCDPTKLPKDVCDKICSELVDACKRAMGPQCYLAGTPCIAPCNKMGEECEKSKKKDCNEDVSLCQPLTKSG
jgi:RHS repeat-associated protein